MKWEDRKWELKEVINNNIDWAEQEIGFWEDLLEELEKSTLFKEFLKRAKQIAQNHPNVWIRE